MHAVSKGLIQIETVYVPIGLTHVVHFDFKSLVDSDNTFHMKSVNIRPRQ